MTDQPVTPEERQRRRSRWLLAKFLLWVGIPTLLGGIYLGFVATDLFQSESRYVIQTANGATSISLDSILGELPGNGSDRDALAVRDYILSRDVLRRLDREHGFIAHFRNAEVDWFTRIGPDESFEDIYKYYLTKVGVQYDNQSGVSILTVKALSADKAAEFASAILRYGEEMVNRLSERARRDRMAFARKEVADSEARLARARNAILSLQSSGEEINPAESAAAVLAIRNELETELAKARAELGALKAFMQPDAHKVVFLKQKIESLREQIEKENRRLVDPSQQGLSAVIARFEPLLIEKEFAEKAYASALTSLELARTEAAQQHRYLAVIVTPSRPDESTHPKRLLGVVTVFFVSLAVFGIGSLLIAAVREHARV